MRNRSHVKILVAHLVGYPELPVVGEQPTRAKDDLNARSLLPWRAEAGSGHRVALGSCTDRTGLKGLRREERVKRAIVRVGGRRILRGVGKSVAAELSLHRDIK